MILNSILTLFTVDKLLVVNIYIYIHITKMALYHILAYLHNLRGLEMFQH